MASSKSPLIGLNEKQQIIIDNVSEYGGNVVDSFSVNLDFKNSIDSHVGDIGFLPAPLAPHTFSKNVAALKVPQTILYGNPDGNGTNAWWFNDSAGNVYRSTNINNAFTLATGAPTDATGDMVVFGTKQISSQYVDQLIVARNSDLAYYNNGAWDNTWWTVTLVQAALQGVSGTGTALQQHILKVMQKPFTLFITDRNLIHTIDQNNIVLNSRLTLPTKHIIAWCEIIGQKAYFGVYDSLNNDSGGMYEYDPINEIATYYSYDSISYSSNTSNENAGVGYVYKNILYIIYPDKTLRYFNGTDFIKISDSPFSKKRGVANGFHTNILHRNGIISYNEKLFFLISTNNNLQNHHDLRSGIYVYDFLQNNFYHYYPIVQNTGDAGQIDSNSSGALFYDGSSSTFLAGFACYDTANYQGLFSSGKSLGTQPQRPWIITPKRKTQAILNAWYKVWFSYILSSGDTIMVKYRTTDFFSGIPDYNGGVGATVHSVTWTDTKTFTSTDVNLSTILAGYECVIVTGQNSGLSAFVSSITLSSGTYTVVLDTAIGLASGTSNLSFSNFLKVGTITDSTKQFLDVSIPSGISSNWIQFKIEIQGLNTGGTYIRDIQIAYNPMQMQ